MGSNSLDSYLSRFINLLVLTEIKMNMEKNGNVKLEMEINFLQTEWQTETLRGIEGGNSMNRKRIL